MLTTKKFINVKPILNLLFPPNCAECGDLIMEEVGVCPGCWQKMSYIEKPYCQRLGIPFEYDPGGEVLSAEALAHPPAYDKARYVARYDNVARSLVQKLKFRDQTHLGKLMGELMVKAATDIVQTSDIIIPVPLHRRRLFMRRYNQASLLAQEVSKKTRIAVEHSLLERRVPTRSQIGLSAKERQQNVKGAFHIDNKEILKGKTVLLIDDVVTTGSTVNACARILMASGADTVNVLGFARVTDMVHTL